MRRVVTISALVAVVLSVIAGIAFWRWYAWITTPPEQLAVASGELPSIDGPRMAAEWEPATGVLVAWPLHLPRDLIVALASEVRLYVTVSDDEARADAAGKLTAWGVPDNACTFIVTPQGDGWYGTRDWGPVAVFDRTGRCHLVDARYLDYPASGPGDGDAVYWLSRVEGLDFSPDDDAPAAVAETLGLPRVEFPYALTGGAVATDGLGTAFVTEAVIRENELLGVSRERLLEAAESVLGIERFVVVPNYERLGVHHIDCLLKLLDSERILVKRPPRDHEEYRAVEKAVEVLSNQSSPSGRPYEVLRIDTPRYRDDELANYTNALILNGRVYVPLFGIDADEQAMAIWRRVMADHEVLGFEYEGEHGWTYTDALHCRAKAIWDPDPER
jgi:agmatine/peptidylarginine deiminase